MSENSQNEFYIRQIDALKRHLGEEILSYLKDPDINEILYNTDGYLWIDHYVKGLIKKGTLNAIQVRLAMDTLASLKNTQLDISTPILECELPFNKERFEGIIQPISSQPIFSIRKPISRPICLIDYINQGIFTFTQYDQIIHALSSHQNILVAGGTGSGKTTFVYAMLHEIQQRFPQERLILLEDTPEIALNTHNSLSLVTSEFINLTRLLKATLRLRPDRIIVGEVRGSEALTLLKAWNTGHPGGISTLHANDAQGALLRLEQLIEESGVPLNRQLIGHTVNLIIVIKKTASGRGVSEIVQCMGYDGHNYLLKEADFFQGQRINLDLFSGVGHENHKQISVTPQSTL
ncbi:MAG: P-type conjugative transfer ATPase TrbB [Betaproteobacteria bacterium]|nr:P-type conjugative transfer ATPase TrbB [Betaproteobacteria bacterium]MDE2056441.1 P-type conjugative transfer ATPase TrbB [Betaproteobacteria bacterium]